MPNAGPTNSSPDVYLYDPLRSSLFPPKKIKQTLCCNLRGSQYPIWSADVGIICKEWVRKTHNTVSGCKSGWTRKAQEMEKPRKCRSLMNEWITECEETELIRTFHTPVSEWGSHQEKGNKMVMRWNERARTPTFRNVQKVPHFVIIIIAKYSLTECELMF